MKDFEIGDEIQCIDDKSYNYIKTGETAFVEGIQNKLKLSCSIVSAYSYIPKDFKLIRSCRDIRVGDWMYSLIDCGNYRKVGNIYKCLNAQSNLEYKSDIGKSEYGNKATFRRAAPSEVKAAGFEWEDKVEEFKECSTCIDDNEGFCNAEEACIDYSEYRRILSYIPYVKKKEVDSLDLVKGEIYKIVTSGSPLILRFEDEKIGHLDYYSGFNKSNYFCTNSCYGFSNKYDKLIKATYQERKKLIKAEKDNGYNWNGKELVKVDSSFYDEKCTKIEGNIDIPKPYISILNEKLKEEENVMGSEITENFNKAKTAIEKKGDEAAIESAIQVEIEIRRENTLKLMSRLKTVISEENSLENRLKELKEEKAEIVTKSGITKDQLKHFEIS